MSHDEGEGGMDEYWMESDEGEVCMHVTRDRKCDMISNSKKKEGCEQNI